MNYSINEQKNQVKSTILSIMGDISDLFGNEIPYPHLHYFSNEYNRMVYSWYIDGFFGTANNVRFLNDVIARFKLTADCQLHSLKSSIVEYDNSLKLKRFMGLKSLAKDKLKEKYKRVETRADDYVFWCLKLYAEDLIRQDGLIIWNTLENWAFNNFIDLAKDKSTLKAKCRNIFNWYCDRDWKIGRCNLKNKEEIMATRQEHARNMARKKEDVNIKKIDNALTGLMADSLFKKKNGKWNAKAIADYLKLDTRTVMKYLKQLNYL